MPWSVYQKGRELPLITCKTRRGALEWIRKAADRWAATMTVRRTKALVRPWPPSS